MSSGRSQSPLIAWIASCRRAEMILGRPVLPDKGQARVRIAAATLCLESGAGWHHWRSSIRKERRG